jgi:hypothetical protein
MGTPIHKQTVGTLWLWTFVFPALGGAAIALTVRHQPAGPPWQGWLASGGTAVGFWFLGWVSTGFSFRELRQRGCWLPPGAGAQPWLLAAAFSALVTILAALLWLGLFVGAEALT